MQQNDHDIRKAIAELPEGLNATYTRSLERIDSLGPKGAARCRLALQWVLGTWIPLKPEQLAEAVAIKEMDDGIWQPEKIINKPLVLIDHCAGLCSLDVKGQVQLTHASVKDFLCSSEYSDMPTRLSEYHEPQLHLDLAQMCLQYIATHAQVHPLQWPYGDDLLMVSHYVGLDPSSLLHHAKTACDSANLSDVEFDRLILICDQFRIIQEDPGEMRLEPDLFLFASSVTCYGGRLAQALIQKGADIRVRDTYGNTALHYAVAKGSFEVCSLLLACGADVNSKNSRGQTPMHRSLSHFSAKASSVVPLLAQSGGDFSAQDKSGRTPLHDAVEVNGKLAEALLGYGADVNCREREGNTPLHLARLDCIGVLISYGADVNAVNNTGRTALHDAVVDSSAGRVAFLLNCNANVGARDHHGLTPLHLACRCTGFGLRFRFRNCQLDRRYRKVEAIYKSWSCVVLLLRRRANIHATDNGKATPLHVLANHLGPRDDGLTRLIRPHTRYECMFLFAFISLAVPAALGVLDNRRRSPEAYARLQGTDPRIHNMLLRLHGQIRVAKILDAATTKTLQLGDQPDRLLNPTSNALQEWTHQLYKGDIDSNTGRKRSKSAPPECRTEFAAPDHEWLKKLHDYESFSPRRCESPEPLMII